MLILVISSEHSESGNLGHHSTYTRVSDGRQYNNKKCANLSLGEKLHTFIVKL